jgi:3-methyladenine DNA glycosylase AlkD
MQAAQVIDKLKSLADPRAVKVWNNMYGNGNNFLGVNFTKLKGLAKGAKRDQQLFIELWATKIIDAQVFATMICEPRKFTKEIMDVHMQDIQDMNFPALADKYCQYVIVKTQFVEDKINSWYEHPAEYFRRSAYLLMRYQAGKNSPLPDNYFLPILQLIAERLQSETNWAKEIMNYTLIAIGERNLALNEAAMKVAKAIGPVHIDYGDTACKTANAVASLQKAEKKFIQSAWLKK